jgi:hypothetical protein
MFPSVRCPTLRGHARRATERNAILAVSIKLQPVPLYPKWLPETGRFSRRPVFIAARPVLSLGPNPMVVRVLRRR